MPTYIFACKQCQHEFQIKASWQDKRSACCPVCGSTELHELFGRYHINVATPAKNAVPDQCQGCAHPSPGCPMSGH